MPLLSVADFANFPVIAADHRLPYGEDDHQFADLYLPPGDGPHPVIIVIHGGCWRARYNLDGLGQLCRALNQMGYAAWSLEYRRIGHEGREWQHTFEDVGVATDRLRTLASPYNLILDHIVAMGHSAGGHLALWLAARHRLMTGSPLVTPNPLPIHGVISLAGIPDLPAALAQGICGTAISELLDATPEIAPERYSAASPRAHLPLGVPQILINGGQDQLVPLAYVATYAAAAQAAGDRVRLDTVDHAGHFEIVAPTSHAWNTVARAVRELATDDIQ